MADTGKGSRTGTRCGSSSPTSPPNGPAPAWAWPSSIPSWPKHQGHIRVVDNVPKGQNSSSIYPCTGPTMPGNLLVVDDEPQITQVVSASSRMKALRSSPPRTATPPLNWRPPTLRTWSSWISLCRAGWSGGAARTEKAPPPAARYHDLGLRFGGECRQGHPPGAYDFIEKPPNADKILLSVRNALELARLSEENRRLRQQGAQVKEIIGVSDAMRRLREEAGPGWPPPTPRCSSPAKTAPARSWWPEPCTPKAGGPTTLSWRSTAPPSPRPHRKRTLRPRKGGLHRGLQPAPGQIRLAHEGSLFLDEIGDMSLKTQAKILRILEEQRFERVGGSRPIQVDVRGGRHQQEPGRGNCQRRLPEDPTTVLTSSLSPAAPQGAPGGHPLLATHFLQNSPGQ